MATEAQIHNYLSSLPEAKRSDMQTLHDRFLHLLPGGRLWFLDGRNDEGKVVSNPNIGYGEITIKYADGSSKEFFRIGLSANTAGISVYVMGLEDKEYLRNTLGGRLGKATITGYCIKFKKLADINRSVLEEVIIPRLI
ncbi:DUF1801 domain-containing protein [Flavobacterium sp. MFBS3-15]|uniref:DUF1801 domain-containing protein n=1 Tax=Flavobacterium sp. MFBS3-15 TaxID=2989816 RepID=UPI002236042C|nr:DUF1801 domain-containing protein [Flavobacterium sp. MFBS3-15]MCW4469842.1 DUF1801 domain-containing protein [Flavobacterium sp. MFBS3-15]